MIPTFTPEESHLLLDILDNWEEGVKVAKKETTIDPTVTTAEELVDLSVSYDEQSEMVKSIREKVRHDSIAISADSSGWFPL